MVNRISKSRILLAPAMSNSPYVWKACPTHIPSSVRYALKSFLKVKTIVCTEKKQGKNTSFGNRFKSWRPFCHCDTKKIQDFWVLELSKACQAFFCIVWGFKGSLTAVRAWIVPWIDLPHEGSEGGAANFRLWESCLDRWGKARTLEVARPTMFTNIWKPFSPPTKRWFWQILMNGQNLSILKGSFFFFFFLPAKIYIGGSSVRKK